MFMISFPVEKRMTRFSRLLIGTQLLSLSLYYGSFQSDGVVETQSRQLFSAPLWKHLVTTSTHSYPNPLSCFAVTSVEECAWNCLLAGVVAGPVTAELGLLQGALLYVTSGLFSSFAFIFSSQCRADEVGSIVRTDASMSSGAFAGFATICLTTPMSTSLLRQVKAREMFAKAVSAVFLLKLMVDEYGGFSESSEVVRSSGAIGGICYGLIHRVLFFRTRQDLLMRKKFYSNLVQSKWDKPIL